MDDYQGVIIEESLKDAQVLKGIRIVKTRISKVTKRHKTPWLTHWTLHTVMIRESKADQVARDISLELDESHGESWYADFRNNRYHYIVFPNRVFRISITSARQYAEARRYGRSLGIPEYQLDFTPS